MKIEFINPFIDAVNNALETMVGILPSRLKPFIKKGRSTIGDVTGLIGFAEKRISGSVSMSFTFKSISIIYEKMMGCVPESMDGEVEDLVGEITNIVAGGAKTSFAELGYPFNITLPIVVSGKDHTIKHKHDTPIIVIPFNIDDNLFTMEISLQIK